MSFEQKDYDLIIDYIRGNLSDNENESFEHRMETEEALYNEVQLYKGISIAMNEEGWVDWNHKNHQAEITKIKEIKRSKEVTYLEEKITAASDTYFNNTIESTTKSYYKKYAIGLVAAIACIFLLRTFITNSSTADLYAAHVNWEQNLISKTEQSSESDTNIGQLGESFFKKGEYTKAIDIFNQNENIDSHALMYIGASYLELNMHDNALQTFDQLLNLKVLDSNRAYWYRAMVFLKKGNKESAINELKLLTSNPKNYNYKQAKDLLTKLY